MHFKNKKSHIIYLCLLYYLKLHIKKKRKACLHAKLIVEIIVLKIEAYFHILGHKVYGFGVFFVE